jgi:dihydrofolate reductase
MISIIVAASENNVIGMQGEMPWRLSSDLKRFKALTMGKPMIMGRLTFESIGKALPGRQNIVISSQEDYAAEGCDVVTSVSDAIATAGEAEEIMVIGGGEIYKQCLPLADRVYLTRVHTDIDGDTWFAELPESEWHETWVEHHVADIDNAFDYSFVELERNSS